jgi:G3E family GTPase
MIPVNIITGFLGAGKTTAIIQLLNQKTSDEQWAVIINEFGKISIDSQTLRSSTDAGKIFDISGGCICCSAKGYFHENLTEIINSGNYSRIIIEPSGLGGIDMVSEIVVENGHLELMPILCLVDIFQVENTRLQMVPIYRIQIVKSDIIVFTKCDLLDDNDREKDLKTKFKNLFPEKNIEENVFISCQNDSKLSHKESISSFSLITPKNNDLLDSNFQKKIFTFDASFVFDTDKLALLFRKYPEILRAKGHINTKTSWQLINYTLSGCNFERCEPKNQNEIVLITENVTSAFFQEMLSKIQTSIII